MFRSKTVDSVLSTFNKTVSELRAVATEQEEIAVSKREVAQRLDNEANDAARESHRADVIANRLLALLED